jgi:hypothetical protein
MKGLFNARKDILLIYMCTQRPGPTKGCRANDDDMYTQSFSWDAKYIFYL